MRRVLLLAVIVAIGLVGCYGDMRVEVVSDTGTIIYLTFEGGFFGIADDHGRHWDPSDLPAEFQADSLRVRFEGVVTDEVTCHMWGRTIDLTSIEREK